MGNLQENVNLRSMEAWKARITYTSIIQGGGLLHVCWKRAIETEKETERQRDGDRETKEKGKEKRKERERERQRANERQRKRHRD